MLTDALNTIENAGTFETTIYTDGSAEGGTSHGGSAAVITGGPPSDPIRRNTLVQKGCRLTSSFETEITALTLATEYLASLEHCPPTIICTDSQASLTALLDSGKKDSMKTAALRKSLNSLMSPTLLQWIPGHCGLQGNEWADKAAGDIAADRETAHATQSGISFQAAKSYIKREMLEPPISHVRTLAVYDGKRDAEPLQRPDAVLLAQLRSGHCRKLAAFRNVVDSYSSPTCPHCEEGFETLEHWLQVCPATAAKRIRVLGGVAPPLSILVSNPRAVLAFAHGLWTM